MFPVNETIEKSVKEDGPSSTGSSHSGFAGGTMFDDPHDGVGVMQWWSRGSMYIVCGVNWVGGSCACILFCRMSRTVHPPLELFPK